MKPLTSKHVEYLGQPEPRCRFSPDGACLYCGLWIAPVLDEPCGALRDWRGDNLTDIAADVIRAHALGIAL